MCQLFNFVFRLSEAESLFPAESTRGVGVDDDPLVSQFGDSSCFALQILAKILASSERGSQVSFSGFVLAKMGCCSSALPQMIRDSNPIKFLKIKAFVRI